MLPTLDVTELRRRLGVGAEIPDAILTEVLAAVRSIVDPRVDQTTMPEAAAAYRGGCYQLAVKVYQSSNVGLGSYDPSGSYDFVPTATSGIIRSVWGVLAPCMSQPAGAWA